MKQENKTVVPEVIHASTNVLYADRITNVAFGPMVSRLTLSMELGPNIIEPTHTLVIPTSALIDVLNFMQETLHANDELKNGLLDSMALIKAQLEKL